MRARLFITCRELTRATSVSLYIFVSYALYPRGTEWRRRLSRDTHEGDKVSQPGISNGTPERSVTVDAHERYDGQSLVSTILA